MLCNNLIPHYRTKKPTDHLGTTLAKSSFLLRPRLLVHDVSFGQGNLKRRLEQLVYSLKTPLQTIRKPKGIAQVWSAELPRQDKIQRQHYWDTVLARDRPERAAPLDRLSDSSECSGLTMRVKSGEVSLRASPRVGSLLPTHGKNASLGRKGAMCTQCATLFKRRYDLLQHISAVHQKLRPYKCTTCATSFAHKGTLSKHVRTVHKRERPYACEHCGLRFSERGNVNKHKQRAQSCRSKEEKAGGTGPSSGSNAAMDMDL